MKKITTVLIVLVLFIQTQVFSQSCLPNGITFENQIDIDDFQTNNPNCTEIEGDVMISGTDITNLNGLFALNKIGKDLSIYNCSALVSLSGLDSLTTIGERLRIVDNDELLDLKGLDKISSIGGNIWIWNNSGLTNFSGLDNLSILTGDLLVQNNESLADLTALNNITSIGGALNFYKNNYLTSLTGLNNLTMIGGELAVEYNSNLKSLMGLENIISSGNGLIIASNDSLTSLVPLSNITSIGGYLSITNNITLKNLSGIDSIDAGSIIGIMITGNPILSTCEAQSICSYITSPSAEIYIFNNANGCNSLSEIENACNELGTSDFYFHPKLSIYPNPTKDRIYITNKNNIFISTVNIYNQLGQKVFSQKMTTNNIDISRINQGIYFIEFVSPNLRFRDKLIIER